MCYTKYMKICSYYHCKNETKNKYCSDDCRVFGRYKTIRPFKAYVWDLYSQYIRQRDADDSGMVKCCTCDRREMWDSGVMHAGHYEHGDDPGILFNDKNINTQCAGCNTYRNGNRNAYAIFLESKYGYGILQELQKAKTHKVWNMVQLRKAYKEVREKLDGLTR